jgi:[acyl-carrier-protein] S-malonyltransferase
MVTGFVFPGQGSQKVGMGRSWAEESAVARSVFAEADETLGFALSRLCWEGPVEELQLTANTQPAILTVSVATWRAVVDSGLAPRVVAGHSLGEYSALVAAGTLAFADALRLVRRRGELMQEAVPVGIGAMAAVIGLPASEVALLAQQAAGDQVCAVANYNAPIQTVVAGHRSAVERTVALAKEYGAKRALLLPVSAPFHCELMRPAREALTPLLEATPFHDPRVPVMTNVDAAPVTTGVAAREALARQVDSPVRWVESIERMVTDHGVERFVEIGPGSVLTGLMRRIARGPLARSLAEPADLAGILAAAKEESR